MMREIKRLLPGLDSPKGRVRCFGHVLNLVVKAIMSQFTQRRRQPKDKDVEALGDPEDVDEDDLDEADEADTSCEAADEQIIENMDKDHPDLVISADDVKMGRVAVEKIVKLSQKVFHSPTIRAELARLAGEADLNAEVLVR
ncbi:hypothetical protein K466DRAFT_472566, partial [Polyporus arcularius HHB13444]